MRRAGLKPLKGERRHDVCSTSSCWRAPRRRCRGVRARVDGERPVEGRVRSGQRRHQAARRVLRAGGRRTTSARRGTSRSRRTATSTSRSEPRRTRPAGDGRRRHRRCATRTATASSTIKEQFGTGSTTGVGLRNGYLYLAHPKTIERFKMTRGPAEAGRRGRNRRHGPARRLAAARRQGPHVRRQGLAVHQRRRAVATRASSPIASPGAKGQDPVPDSREARRHLEVRREQARTRRRTTGTKFATGLRQIPAITWHDGALYIVMNNRDQLDVVLARDSSRRRTTPSGRPSRCIARCRARTSAGRTASTTIGRRSSS